MFWAYLATFMGVPKEGPSAGITIVTGIVSALKNIPVRNSIAMTGEITIMGKVLPVGGIKEKILAAKRAKINDIILSKENKKDIEDIREDYIKGIRFHYVDKMIEVVDIALLKEKVNDPLELHVPEMVVSRS